MFALQVLLVVVLVVAAGLAAVLQARSTRLEEIEKRSLAAAEAFAHAPGLPAALRSADATAVLQPAAEAARRTGHVDFIVVMNRDGIRYTHPVPALIGQRFVGSLAPAHTGQAVTERLRGDIGELVQVVVPVRDETGAVVGMVSAGLSVGEVSEEVRHQLRVVAAAGTLALLVATAGTAAVGRRLRRQTHGLGPAEMTRMYEHHDAVLHAVREGVVIVAASGRLLLVNDEARRLLHLPADAEGRTVRSVGLEGPIADLLASGRTANDEVVPVGGRVLAVNHRPTGAHGGPPGSVATLRDTTELTTLAGTADIARGRLSLLYDAGMAIGTTLDVRRTAGELADLAVGRLADYATVDLCEPVLRGDEPRPEWMDEVTVRRVARRGVRDDHPLYPLGELVSYPAPSPQAREFVSGNPTLVADLHADDRWHTQDPARTQAVMDFGMHSLITIPLKARGVQMGVVNLWQGAGSRPFTDEDLTLAAELAARAALCIDNARRYTREHTLAHTLQRSLLPGATPELSAVESAHRYLPANTGASGDWFDVIALPGARVALVVGDVVGQGLHAAATMGRMRTAVHNFSSLDLPPDELLAHLDELVERIDQEQETAGDQDPDHDDRPPPLPGRAIDAATGRHIQICHPTAP
ncbi:SpoIIE family protein phosphatase, partial [Streptomyces sp. URMC 123]|uniref:SpoIIE family protein phosphatase n=1 Tax=Streptomyces sp. URMC 123 TaxID=3423403 RepID=UPI003F1DDACA